MQKTIKVIQVRNDSDLDEDSGSKQRRGLKRVGISNCKKLFGNSTNIGKYKTENHSLPFFSPSKVISVDILAFLSKNNHNIIFDVLICDYNT